MDEEGENGGFTVDFYEFECWIVYMQVKYDVRKNFADSRLRVKGRFVKKEDEETLRELLTI